MNLKTEYARYGLLRSEMVPDTLERVPEMMDTPPIQ
jgi:hypothetical protein